MPKALALLILALCALPALAQDVPGRASDRFDYYVLALSWSPGFCEEAGQDHAQCTPDRDLGWILHGLWPQYEEGYPRNCAATVPDASRAQTAAMADIMGTAGLAWHEWKAHGRCSGLSAADYFDLSRQAFGLFDLPRPDTADPVRVSAAALEAAIEAGNGLDPDGLVTRCEDGWLREVRICLTRDLAPRPCGPDLRGSCRGSVLMQD